LDTSAGVLVIELIAFYCA